MDDERDGCFKEEWTIYFGSDSSDDEYGENDNDYEEDKIASPEASRENGEAAYTGPELSRSKTKRKQATGDAKRLHPGEIRLD